MAQEVPFKVSIDTGTAEKTIGELRQEFRDLNKVIDQTKAGTDEYNKAVIRLGAVKGTLKDVREQMLALDPEKRLAAFSRIGSTVASGFSAATAAAALFGDKNEELGKTIVKVQAASALASGLQGLSGFKKALVDAQLAMKAFALENPFTAVVVGVVALTAAIYGLVKAFDKTADEIDQLKKAAEDLDEFAKNSESFWNRQIKLLEAQGKSLEDIHARRKEMIREQLEDNADAIKIQQQLADKGDEDAIKKLGELENKRKDLLADREIEEAKFASDKAKRDEETTKKEAEELKKRNEISAKAIEEKKKHDEAAWKEELKLLDDSIDDAIKLFEREVAAEQKMFEDRQKARQDYYATVINLELKNMADQAALDENPIEQENARYQQQLVDQTDFQSQQLTLLQTQVDTEVITKEDGERRKKELQDKFNTQNLIATKQHNKNLLTAEQDLKNQKLLIIGSGINSIGQLAIAFAGKSEASQRRAFEIQKAAGIATATIDTYVAANKAAALPLPPPFPAIAAAVAVATGLARVATIAKTEFNAPAPTSDVSVSGGSVGGGAPEAPAIQPPQVTATQTQTNQEGDFTGFGKHIRAYVVESEMTEKQKRIKGIESRSEF